MSADNHKPPNILQKIIQQKALRVEDCKQRVSLAELKQALLSAPPRHDFLQAIRDRISQKQSAVIAEIKKASPSRGVIRHDFDPVQIAQSYYHFGATCLSVLTEGDFFQGADEYLQQVRAACPLPLLRKDFIIDEYQIYESRILGADAVLLIVAALPDPQLQQFYQLAKQLGLTVLVEVHTATELQRALQLSPELIGINNRDLTTFNTLLETTIKLRRSIPAEMTVVTESGIHTKADVQFMHQHDVHAFLIGERFMRAAEPGAALAELFA